MRINKDYHGFRTVAVLRKDDLIATCYVSTDNLPTIDVTLRFVMWIENSESMETLRSVADSMNMNYKSDIIYASYFLFEFDNISELVWLKMSIGKDACYLIDEYIKDGSEPILIPYLNRTVV